MTEPRNTRDSIHFGASDEPETALPPLRLLVAADLSPDGADGGATATRIRIDKNSFNEVLRRLCPRISLQLEWRSSPGDAPVVAEFPVQDLKSFTPAQLIATPAFRDLLDDRNALLDLRDGRIRVEEFKSRIRSDLLRGAVAALLQGPPPARGPVSAPPVPHELGAKHDDILDSILGMVEAPASEAAPVPSEGAERVQAYIADMFKGARPAGEIDRGRADRSIKEIEAVLAGRLNDVLGHPEFRRVEAGWRGLKFLVERSDFRAGIELELVSTSKSGLVGCLESLLTDVDAGIPGVDAVLAAFEFRNTPEDLEIARRAAELAQELRAPVVISVGPAFFGKQTASEVTRIPQLRAQLDSPAFVKWESFRAVESSRWLGVMFNRFLLRNSHTPESARLPFAFREAGEGLWGNPVWGLGSVLVRSYSRTGWCGHITGVRGGGLLEDLPVREFDLPSGDVRHIPLESVFLRGREADFYNEGFLVLQCGEDQDVAALLDAPTVHRPERYPGSRDTEESRHRAKLPYQLVAGRIARYVEKELSQMGGVGAAEVRHGIESALRRLMGPGSEDAVGVLLAESQERAGYYDLGISVRPGPSIWPLPVAVQITVPLRRN